MTSSVIIDRGVAVPMRDGTLLAADVHRAGPEPKPVLLQRTPYNRRSALASYVWGLVEPLAAVDAGFTVVIQDVRGRFASEGEFTPFRNEARDGVDTIEWIRQQPWCDGRVGMYGMSYVGATQLLAAGQAPEGLFAIAPALTASDYYDGWVYEGGIFALGFCLFWSLTDLAPSDIARRAGLDDEGRRALTVGIDALVADLPAAFDHVSPGEVPSIARIAPWYREWLDHPTRDSFWEEISPRSRYGHMAVPALHFGGWYDLFIAGTVENYAGLRTGAATEFARDNQRMIIGPWSHGNLTDAVGGAHLGLGAAMASLDLNAVHLDFFTAALEGRPVPGPPVRVFVLGANAWRDEMSWPPLDTTAKVLFLGTDGSMHPQPETGSSSFVYDPAQPTPTVGGRTFLPGLLSSLNSGMKEQAALTARDDGLLFASAPLDGPLLVIGDVSLSLSVATEGSSLDIVTKLVDVHPDGSMVNLCEGAKRVATVVPGDHLVVEVDLAGIAVEFGAGHRIGLWVGCASHPRLARGTNGTGSAARIVLNHEGCALTLPVRLS